MNFSSSCGLVLSQVCSYIWFCRENEKRGTPPYSVPHDSFSTAFLDKNSTSFSRYQLLTSSSDLYPNLLSCFVVVKPMNCCANCLMALTVFPLVSSMIGLPSSVLLYAFSGGMSSFAFIFSSQFRTVTTLKKNRESSEKTSPLVEPPSSTTVERSSSSSYRSSSPIVSVKEKEYACTSNGAFSGLATLSLLLGGELRNRGSVFYGKKMLISVLSTSYIASCLYEEQASRRNTKDRVLSPSSLSEVSSASGAEVVNAGVIGGIFYGCIHYVLFFRTKFDMALKRKFHANLAHSKWS